MKDNHTPIIQETKSYELFKFIRGNRSVLPGHIKRLKEAISKRNLLPYSPILVNEDFQIIDGQHRFTICKELSLPVYYLQVPGLGIDDVMEINTHTRDWSISDFVDAYIKLGHVEYIQLKQFANLHNTTYSIAAQILMHGTSISVHSNSTTLIKSGNFKATFREFADIVFDALHDVAPYSTFNPLVRRDFVVAFARLIWLGQAIFDPDVLVKKLRFSDGRIEDRASLQMYILHLEDLYNYKNRNRIDLYSRAMNQTK